MSLTPTRFNSGSTPCASSAPRSRGNALHVVHAEGRGPSPLPLLLTHGWPGSFLEYLPVLPLLSDPGAHGADPADAFTVVVPSLPGYAFSGPPPPTGMTGRQVARLWHELMTVGLGYDRFVAHGSDLGAGVTAWLARDQPEAVAAIHLATPGLAVAPGPRTEHEEDFARAVRDWTAEEGGYMHEHATKPATLGAGLSDSPAGLAAWIGEKVVAWSSTRPDGSPAFDRELLLATLTLYWTTETITTSLLPYWAHRHLAGAALPDGDVSPVPTAISIFGGERVPFPKPPRAARRALLQRHVLGRTPHRRPLPRRRRTRAAGAHACATHFARCDTRRETHRHSLLHPRRLTHLAGSTLVPPDFCFGSPARRSGRPRLGSPGATEQVPRACPALLLSALSRAVEIGASCAGSCSGCYGHVMGG